MWFCSSTRKTGPCSRSQRTGTVQQESFPSCTSKSSTDSRTQIPGVIDTIQAMIETTEIDRSSVIELNERGIPPEIWRRCVRYECGKLLGAHRTVRGSSFCSRECYRENNNAIRQWKGSKECRKCGRKARKVVPKAGIDRQATLESGIEGALALSIL